MINLRNKSKIDTEIQKRLIKLEHIDLDQGRFELDKLDKNYVLFCGYLLVFIISN